AATMSSDLDNTDTVKIFFEDTVANGITVLPPDVNASHYRFVPTDPKTIRYGLGAVKGVGEPAVLAIIAAREAGGDFTDLFDFCGRIDRRLVNRRVVEALIRAGAFDPLEAPKGHDRAQLLGTVPVAMEAAEQAAANAAQCGLFDSLPEAAGPPADYANLRPWSEKERLKEEKTAIGFFLSGHPFNAYKDEVRRFVRRPLSRVEPSKDVIMVAGVVMEVRAKMTARGKIAFVLIDDGTEPREISVFSELFDRERDRIAVDEVLVADVKVSNDDFSGGFRIVAERLMTLGEARARFARGLQIRLNGEVAASGGPAAAVERLHGLLSPFRAGDCPVSVCYRNDDAQAELPLGGGWKVRPEEALLEGLRDWLDAAAVEVVYAS
ncbi:MAG: DNA polymerase III subunit alpha, partial [Rhodocyclaceae bacterium]|nr:DNA polymerase III subunit alpha [Rhodocyclaceae bacterium]